MAPDSRESGQARSIVVVEDDRDISELLTSVFDAEGYESIAAYDAESALRLAKTGHPSAITLDLGLPDRDGHQLLHDLKAEVLTRDIPVIVVSAYAARLCPEDNGLVAAIVNKPFDLAELLRITHHAVDARPHLP